MQIQSKARGDAPQVRHGGQLGVANTAAGGVTGFRRVVLSRGARILNPLLRRFAGTRYLRSFAVVEHRGRRSGRSYATPTSARPTPDGFVVPLTFGEGSDWYRNVKAAGGCVIRWNGARYQLTDPEVVDVTTVESAFSPIERVFARLIGIKHVVRLRFVHPA